jgi:ATP-dependent DNA helicase RecG
MLPDEVLRRYARGLENDHVERTQSTKDIRKFGEAICAFANDLADRRETGVLLVGVKDDGTCAHIDIDEPLLQRLLSFRRDGTILPPPSMTVRKVDLDGCTIAVVEVEPSEMPPVRYDGRVCVRAGPRRDYATPEEERRLIEKRRWKTLPFDQQPAADAQMTDLDLLRFREEYLRVAVHPDVLAENGRTVEEQLRAVGFITADKRATVVGVLVCGNDPRSFVPGAYLQFVRYPGREIGDVVQDHKELGGPLSQLLGQIDELIATNVRRRSDLSGVRQVDRPDYPPLALQELVRNAVIHRTYDGTSAPVMLSWFEDRVEITSPGGPYGIMTIDMFPQPGISDARNPALATAAKTLGFVQRFGSGIPRAQAALSRNGNSPAEFRAERHFVHVVVRAVP